MEILRRLLTFFRPTRLKLVFLLEWAAFIALTWGQGKLPTAQAFLVTAYPLALFYGAGCILAAASKRAHGTTTAVRLAAWIIALVAADLLAKALVAAALPHGASIPVISGWLHLAHQRNELGAWVAQVLQMGAWTRVLTLSAVAAICIAAPICYRYYVTSVRPSIWADTAFVCLLAGGLSWAGDMAARGAILDYLELPGIVAADFKDILLAIGGAAVIAEALANPNVSWRWRGLRAEMREASALVKRVLHFTRQEWGRMRRATH